MRPNKYATVKFRDKSIDPFHEYDDIVDHIMFYNDSQSERDDISLICELMSIGRSTIISCKIEDLDTVSIVSDIKKIPPSKGGQYLWSCGYQGLNASKNTRTIWIVGGSVSSYKEASDKCESEIKKIEKNEIQYRYFHV